MPALPRPVAALLREEKRRSVATFKASLRAWQARYQAQRGTPAPEFGKVSSQTPVVLTEKTNRPDLPTNSDEARYPLGTMSQYLSQ